MQNAAILDPEICHKARLSRDPRFDGRFFTAVKSTGIFCRSICPASPPLEKNVRYFSSSIAAAEAGFRPCLRCRPDSAPGSPAWRGVATTLDRAIRLIDQGALQNSSLTELSQRLGISDRYLRRLFVQQFNVSPKRFSLIQQCLFAKQLLHQTQLPVTQVALASGFNSLRRFNSCFKAEIGLKPTQVRKLDPSDGEGAKIQLKLYYRPPYNWEKMQQFLSSRVIEQLEWIDAESYGRTFNWYSSSGRFTAQHNDQKNCFNVILEIDDLRMLKPVVNNIRRILDLDTDIAGIDQTLKSVCANAISLHNGMRLPGTWNMFEAGIRAILGQQISITAARRLVTLLVEHLGEPYGEQRLFPTPEKIANSDLAFFKMPASRKQTLKGLASHYLSHQQPDNPEDWLKIKGIGPWTVDYARMRGLSDPDIFLSGDLGIKKALVQDGEAFNPEHLAPWRSYLTFQLWNQH